MNFASIVKNQIQEYYGGNSINHPDLIKHLENDLIDWGWGALHSVSGYDSSYDGSMVALYFTDESILIVSPYSIIAR